MGLGALFLAIEARAVLENGTSTPDQHPPTFERPFTSRQVAILSVWPIISFVVFGSTMVHGMSVLFMSLFTHFSHTKDVRAPLLDPETDPVESIERDAERYRDEPEDDLEAAQNHTR